MSKQLKIQQVRSTIGRLKNQKLTMKALGIRRIRGVAVHNDTPAIRGMIARVRHLVTVEEVQGA